MGLLHKVQLGELVIFMLDNLLLVMQQFRSTLYWRSLASIALEVWLSLIMCFSSRGGGILYSMVNWLNLSQFLGSKESSRSNW